MKKSLLIAFVLMLCLTTACSFHSKQPVDDTYYKKTQSVGWPD